MESSINRKYVNVQMGINYKIGSKISKIVATFGKTIYKKNANFQINQIIMQLCKTTLKYVASKTLKTMKINAGYKKYSLLFFKFSCFKHDMGKNAERNIVNMASVIT